MKPAMPGRPGDADVVGDTEVRQQRQFLEHADEAVPHRVERVDEMHRLAVHLHNAAVGPHRAGDDLDQSALAGAVLAQHGVDGAPPAGEIDAVERGHPAVPLAHVAQAQERRIGATAA